jgi:hypothetical protein
MWLFLMMFGPTAGFWSLASTLGGATRPASEPIRYEP